VERLERGGMQNRVWRHVPAFLGKMVRGDRQGHIRRGGTVLSGTFGRQPQAFGGTGRLDIRRTRPQKQEQKHKKSNSMQGNIISLICNSCGCGQTEAQEYLDSEIRYLRELQEADDLREDDMETACLNLGLDLDYREYFINRLAGA